VLTCSTDGLKRLVVPLVEITLGLVCLLDLVFVLIVKVSDDFAVRAKVMALPLDPKIGKREFSAQHTKVVGNFDGLEPFEIREAQLGDGGVSRGRADVDVVSHN